MQCRLIMTAIDFTYYVSILNKNVLLFIYLENRTLLVHKGQTFEKEYSRVLHMICAATTFTRIRSSKDVYKTLSLLEKFIGTKKNHICSSVKTPTFLTDILVAFRGFLNTITCIIEIANTFTNKLKTSQ